MTVTDIGNELKKMYNKAPKGEQVVMIHLFGIKYAKQIQIEKYTTPEIVNASGIGTTYCAEVNKGIKLAKYVTIKESVDF